jgi:hypothetical protein
MQQRNAATHVAPGTLKARGSGGASIGPAQRLAILIRDDAHARAVARAGATISAAQVAARVTALPTEHDTPRSTAFA